MKSTLKIGKNNRCRFPVTIDLFYKIKEILDESITEFYKAKRGYEIVVFPEDGIGTGFARLEEKAPVVFAYLQGALHSMSNGKIGIDPDSIKEICDPPQDALF